jgi:DNA-directed RNA polymerase subunit RPC12/RpoP
MRTGRSIKFFAVSALVLLLWGSPVYSSGQEMYADARALQTDDSSPVDESSPVEDSKEQKSITCPNCGKKVAIGGHGQTGKTTVCPYCGKEICLPEEEEKGLCLGADAGFFNKYVSRGVTLSEDPVFQPDVWASYRGVTLSVWGNMDLTDVNENEAQFNELDLTLDYSGQWDALSYSAGGIYYIFPNTGSRDTAEVYTSLHYDMMLEPTLTVYYDFVEADGFYVVLGIGHGLEIPLRLDVVTVRLELGMQVGWGSRNFIRFNAGVHNDALTDWVTTASLPVTLGEHLTVSPMISYSSVLDKDIRAANEQNDNFIWGATLSSNF